MHLTEQELMDQWALRHLPPVQPRYNIAPTQPVLVIRADSSGRPSAALCRWGLVPSWADDPSVGPHMINARSETVFQRPAFRSAARCRRCLIPATGFYEWQRIGPAKQPWVFYLDDWAGFAFAGLWERWPGHGDRPPLETCTILTTPANPVCRPIHPRMPLILPAEHYARWLDPSCRDQAALADLMVPFQAVPLRCHRVCTRVNNPANDDPSCLEPAG